MKISVKRLTLQQKRAVAGWCFILPFALGLILVFFPSMIRAVFFSLSSIKINSKGYELEFVGWKHYISALSENAWYVRNLTETFVKMVTNVPLIIAFSFFMSNILNKQFIGRSFSRAVLFLPVIIMSGVIIKLDTTVDRSLGLVEAIKSENQAIRALDVQRLLLSLNIAPGIVTEIADAIANLYTVINTSGVQILIFLAALQTIPSSLYEASTVEGASAWTNFWKITFPMLTPYILANVVYTVVDSLVSYNTPVMQVIMATAQETYGDLSLSIAMSFIFFALVAVVLGVISLIVSKMVFYYD